MIDIKIIALVVTPMNNLGWILEDSEGGLWPGGMSLKSPAVNKTEKS